MTIKQYECANEIKFDNLKIYAVEIASMYKTNETSIYKLVRADDHVGREAECYVFQSESDTRYHLGRTYPESEINEMFRRLLDGSQAYCKPSAIYEFDNYIEFLKWCMNKAELVGVKRAK